MARAVRASRIKVNAGKRIACCVVPIARSRFLLSRPIKTAATPLRKNNGIMARLIRKTMRLLKQIIIQVYWKKCYWIKRVLLPAASRKPCFSRIKTGSSSVRKIEIPTPARSTISYTPKYNGFLRITSMIYSGTASCFK